MLTLGEVHTGLLQHATALPQAQVSRMLNLREGETVLRSQRPTAYAVSPDLLTGVDCELPSNSGRHVRGAGTVVSRRSSPAAGSCRAPRTPRSSEAARHDGCPGRTTCRTRAASKRWAGSRSEERRVGK